MFWSVGGFIFVGFLLRSGYKRKTQLESIQDTNIVPCHQAGMIYLYPDEVDLRIIVMTFSRSESLRKLLLSLNKLEMDGHKASLEIWVDKKRDGDRHNIVDDLTLQIAQSFSWSRGQTRVHIHKKHVGIYGQWLDTWRPDRGGKELALFLEDDITVSPFAYRWLKAVHQKYGSRNDIAGYTLQSEQVKTAHIRRSINRPRHDAVFLYKLLGSWGYAPHPKSWCHFQDWYREVKKDFDFHPYVSKAMIMTRWYKIFEKQNKQDTMWTMWHIYYCDRFNKFTVYNNIPVLANSSSNLLSVNRMEAGLHFDRKRPDNTKNLLQFWSDDFIKLPDLPLSFDFDGTLTDK
ncbi:hypothetical protein LSH36_940g01036 [Paralvinella palmiformis]|uniref:Uncharacterized protein n=1 Tax=Paralvinella palmiformis TaxID=53620 RepID=A0AAD9IYR8_9ANNE|nr:hypothetical protein LSH36_940g01036 [Paralvinella palmiformis]